jgi:hypothetical protein
MSKSPRRPKLSKDEKEDLKWAATEFVPWDHSPTPGPSHDQWMTWNNEHGAAVRMACAIMMRTKDQLAELVLGLESGECRFDDLVKTLDHSAKFFTEMSNIIAGAQARLMVGASVVSVRIRKGEVSAPPRREKPKLRLVQNLDDLIKTELSSSAESDEGGRKP